MISLSLFSQCYKGETRRQVVAYLLLNPGPPPPPSYAVSLGTMFTVHCPTAPPECQPRRCRASALFAEVPRVPAAPRLLGECLRPQHRAWPPLCKGTTRGLCSSSLRPLSSLCTPGHTLAPSSRNGAREGLTLSLAACLPGSAQPGHSRGTAGAQPPPFLHRGTPVPAQGCMPIPGVLPPPTCPLYLHLFNQRFLSPC